MYTNLSFLYLRTSVTCTMAICKRSPRKPIAIEATAITVGPMRNLTAIAKAAIEFPQAIILGCNAMNKPAVPKEVV